MNTLIFKKLVRKPHFYVAFVSAWLAFFCLFFFGELNAAFVTRPVWMVFLVAFLCSFPCAVGSAGLYVAIFQKAILFQAFDEAWDELGLPMEDETDKEVSNPQDQKVDDLQIGYICPFCQQTLTGNITGCIYCGRWGEHY